MRWTLKQAMPFATGTLYARLQADTGADWAKFIGHRFVRELAAGTLDHAEYIAWMVQDYLYLIHYARATALLVVKSENVAGMRSAGTLLHGMLNMEMALHRAELDAAGIDAATLEDTPETLETMAYSRYVLDRAQAGDVLDATVVLTACLVGYAEIGSRISQDPATVLDGHRYRPWIETYAAAEYLALAEQTVRRLEELAGNFGADARYPHLLRQFRQTVRLEAAFWNAGRSALSRARTG